MNLRLEYETHLDQLDKYPTHSRPTCYILGMVGESVEFFEKYRDTRSEKTELIKELGDIIWYLTRICTHLNFDTQRLLREARTRRSDQKITQQQILAIFFNIGKIAEVNKKAIRDKQGRLEESDTTNIKYKIINILEALDKICDAFETTYEEVAQQNLAKLLDRLKRNKIQGGGDNR
jgi:NTP pyrophosphatase (non-canonical NTP hydrolase)